MKQKIHELLHENGLVIKFIYGLIILNIIALVLESYQEIYDPFSPVFRAIEFVSVFIFTIEYLLRIWTADLGKKKQRGRLKFILSPLGIIDLLAILPFYLPMLITVDLRVVRILRLLRLLRIFKLARFSSSLKTINQVVKESKADLITTLFLVFLLLVLSSTLMFYVEHEVQPEKFANIGQSFWWAIATLTTVGYGDVYPVTAMGKFLSGIIALLGIGFIALPTGIVSSAFVAKIQERKGEEKKQECTCPNCGTKFTV